MKFLLLSIAIILITVTGFSQTKMDIFAGPQATGVHYTIGGQKQSDDKKIGFQAGVGLKIPFDIGLFFSPAAFYSLKGYKVTFDRPSFPPDVNAKNNNTTIHTFELAALLQFDFNAHPSHFFLKGGPSLDFQLTGKEKFKLMNGDLVDQKMKFSFGDYGHYSANMLGQFGYESANGILFFIQYTLGIASLNNADGGPGIRHRDFGFSIGKYLNGKKHS